MAWQNYLVKLTVTIDHPAQTIKVSLRTYQGLFNAPNPLSVFMKNTEGTPVLVGEGHDRSRFRTRRSTEYLDYNKYSNDQAGIETLFKSRNWNFIAPITPGTNEAMYELRFRRVPRYGVPGPVYFVTDTPIPNRVARGSLGPFVSFLARIAIQLYRSSRRLEHFAFAYRIVNPTGFSLHLYNMSDPGYRLFDDGKQVFTRAEIEAKGGGIIDNKGILFV